MAKVPYDGPRRLYVVRGTIAQDRAGPGSAVEVLHAEVEVRLAGRTGVIVAREAARPEDRPLDDPSRCLLPVQEDLAAYDGPGSEEERWQQCYHRYRLPHHPNAHPAVR